MSSYLVVVTISPSRQVCSDWCSPFTSFKVFVNAANRITTMMFISTSLLITLIAFTKATIGSPINVELYAKYGAQHRFVSLKKGNELIWAT